MAKLSYAVTQKVYVPDGLGRLVKSLPRKGLKVSPGLLLLLMVKVRRIREVERKMLPKTFFIVVSHWPCKFHSVGEILPYHRQKSGLTFQLILK